MISYRKWSTGQGATIQYYRGVFLFWIIPLYIERDGYK